MNYNYIDERFEREIKINVINKEFERLIEEEKEMILKSVCEIIDTICTKFCFSEKNKEKYIDKFRENEYLDVKGIISHILPYIKDEEGKKKIKKLKELYTEKCKKGEINKEEVEYKYTNIQYNRCIRGEEIKEKEYNKKHIEDNVKLLKQTIEIISNKLYINWINTRPYNIEKYKESELYKVTKENLELKKGKYPIWDYEKEKLNKNRGLYIGDIYNVLSKNLFESIKNNKWIIYYVLEKNSGEVKGETREYINIISEMFRKNGFEYNKIVNNIKWEELEVEEKNKFNNIWEEIKEKVITGERNEVTKRENLERIIRGLIIFYEKYYKKIEEKIKKGEYKRYGVRDEEEIDIIKYDKARINESMSMIKGEDIYEYMRESIEEIKDTWYGKEIIENKRGVYRIKEEEEREKKEIPIKLIYNFSKAITHEKRNKKYEKINEYWRSLSDKEKEKINKRLYEREEGIIEWFNISNNIKIIEPKKEMRTEKEKREINYKYYKKIRERICDIIFEVLIKTGILSYVEPEPEITEKKKILSKTKNNKEYVEEIKKRLKKKVLNNERRKEEWMKSYYYITGREYEEEYLKEMYKGGQGMWYTTYAMDWISQIGYYHKYINNRIIYVTGSTGVGKSTQVPKLLLYSLKMIDYNYEGKIICTQPRIPPTVGVSKIISEQMGVAIKKYDEINKKEISSENYYIQYKYSGDEHVKETKNLMLRFCTDGILYQEIKKNILLKKKRKGKYTDKNVYDIVIVDEAHEHNINMDMILTMMKYSAHYNNNIKLIIISATMEEDEPIYRRYYRDINDNRLYPYNDELKKNKLDRINVDRRLHISPPGQTTRFKIKEIYRPGEEYIKIVKEILNESLEGEILLFQPGQSDIIKSVQKINEITPSNVIAIPYYSSMSEEKKTYIQNLDNESKKELRIPKNIRYDIEYDIKKIDQVSKGTYKRIIIVATNIAEASITINTLKYVIDTGTQKINKYDYKINNSKLMVTDISESSRIQRRGRIGRVSSGTIYYLYEKESKAEIKTIYNIAISNLNEKIIELLIENEKERKMFNKINNPNNPKIIEKIKKKKKNMNIIDKIYKNGIEKMIRKQYFINDEFNDYIGNNEDYDYENYRKPEDYYQTGYSYKTLIDNKGEFYIIHPEEINISRNIIGKIKKKKNNDVEINNKEEIKSKKINSFMETLKNNLIIINNDNDENNYIKTEYGIKINRLKETLKISIENLISLVYSYKYKCNEEIIKLISILPSISQGFKNISNVTIKNNKIYYDLNKLKILYDNKYGDSIAAIEIMNKIIKFGKKIIDINEICKKKKNIDIEKIYENNKKKIDKWSEKNYINTRTFKNSYENYINIKKLINNEKIINMINEIIKNIYILPITNNIKEINIIKSLAYGYNYNICKRINSNIYVNINNPILENIMKIKTMNEKSKIQDTMKNMTIKNNYMLYLFRNEETMNHINYFDMNILNSTISYIYNPYDWKNKYNINEYKKYILEILKNESNKKKNILRQCRLIDEYIKTLKIINNDILNNYNNLSFKNIYSITKNKENIKEYIKKQNKIIKE